MLTIPTAGRRTAGRLMVVATVAVALPLTATRAINYVDVPAPIAPSAAPATLAAAAVQTAPVAEPTEPAEPAAPAQPAQPAQPLNVSRDGTLVINGQAKKWRDLTPAEKAEVRHSLARAKEELARANINSAQINHEIRQALAEAKINKAEIRRELAEARAEMERAMGDIDSHATELRRAGQEPERLKVTLRDSLKTLETIDVEAITLRALGSVDQETIDAAVAAAAVSIAAAEQEMERLEQRLEKDE